MDLADLTLIHSEPAGGFYLQRPDGKLSQFFSTPDDAIKAIEACNGPTPPLSPIIDWS